MVGEDFVRTVSVEFEGHLLNAPSCRDEYLRNLYGDYMQLPPEEKQVAHIIKMWRVDEMEIKNH